MKKWLIVLFFFLGLCALGFWVLSGKSSENVLPAKDKEAAMERILDREPVLSEKSPRTWKTYKGEYISFLYPADANIYENNLSSSVLESFSCGILSPRVNLTVQVASGDSVDSYPAVVLRRGDTIYTEGIEELEGSRGIRTVVFTKDSDGIEKSGFFTKNGKIYSVAVTGYQMEVVEEFYIKVVKSISF